LIAAMKKYWLDKIQIYRQANEPVALVTDLTAGLKSIVRHKTIEGDFGLTDRLLAAVRSRIQNDDSGIEISEGGTEFFIQVFSPPLRLILVGAVHIAQALAPLASMAGYEVSIIDPRRAFNTDARFPGITTSHEWPDDGIIALRPDQRTAIVTLTHDPKLDDPALAQALQSKAFYIGALGSRKTHASRLERLHAQGFSPDLTKRIHGPVGLAIGAVTPAEIAISILGHMTAVLRDKSP